MSQKNQSYTLIGTDRIAKVSFVMADVISKPYETNDIQYPACLVEIYEKQTNMFVTCYVLPEFLVFPSYDLLLDYCNKLDKIALPPNHSSECARASPIAPMSLPTTGGDTPLYFILQRYPRKTTIVIKDGQNELFKWHTSIHKPTVHLGWKRIKKVVEGREIVFRNRFEQSHFSWLVKKSFDCDRSLQFSDLLKNKVSFVE